MTKTPLLDKISQTSDLRALDDAALRQLAEEVRTEMIDAVSQTGGHLGSGLGVVELSVALHGVFNTPYDRLIWDVGHQSYPHKILTGRRERIRTLRQEGGLSGFVKRSESPYDAFGTAHSSTSISAGYGMAKAAALLDEKRHVIAVIGDGAMSAGMAYEAMNNVGSSKDRMLVILNDNDMSIAPPVGAMSAYLSRLLSSGAYQSLREAAKGVMSRFPKSFEEAIRRAEEYARGLFTGGTLFEELGFFYVGPVDGHNLKHLLPVLRNIRDMEEAGPVLLHVVTQKGKGYKYAENASDKLHGVTKFDVATGEQKKAGRNIPAYTAVFSKALIKAAEKDDKIVAITAAMPSGTGLSTFAQSFSERCFDVGIAEQHAVTFAAGMACEGFKPFVCIYSTFLQRAYDQVIHDVAIQSLPLRFVLDRAGFVGADGQTHHGLYDLSYLGCIPNMVLMAPSDERDLMSMVATQVLIDDRPSALRYPRGEALGLELPETIEPLTVGKGRLIQGGQGDIALLCIGTILQEAKVITKHLEEQGFKVTLADARFIKPLDETLIGDLVQNHKALFTLEENAIGGFSTQVMNLLTQKGCFDKGFIFRAFFVPDRLFDHASQERQRFYAGLDATSLTHSIMKALS